MSAARVVLIAVLAPGCSATDTQCTGCPAAEVSHLFVADYDDAILRYDGATGAFRAVFAAGDAHRVDRPASVRLGPDGQLYTAGFGASNIVRHDARSGTLMDVFYWDTELLEEPVELAFRGDALWVLGNDTANIVAIDMSGHVLQSFGHPQMRAANDFVLEGDQLFVATESHPQLGSAIQVWDRASGTLVRHFGALAELANATSIALVDGLLCAADHERGQVVQLDPTTGAALGVLIDGLDHPVSLDVGPDGALYVLDAAGLQRFDRATGEPLGVLVPTGDGHLRRPRSFTFVTETELATARHER